MEKRIHLYVSRKHPAMWLAGALMLASVAARIVVFSQMENIHIWRQILWPGAAGILLVLIVFLSGGEMLHRTAVPVWMMGICAAWQLCLALPGRYLLLALSFIGLLFFCGSYTAILAGRHKPWLLLPLFLVALCLMGYMHWQLAAQERSAAVLLPGYLLIAGFLTMLFALRIHTDGKYHPTWKDRSDGRYIRSSPAIEQITPFIMPQRVGANILFDESVEITELDRYVRAKRRAGMPNFGVTHAIVAAYVRTVAKYPALNRFVAGQRIYSLVISFFTVIHTAISSPRE